MSTIFRVENPETMIGLWYNGRGEKTDFIKTIENAQCADLPMEFDPTMKDGGDWFSACDSLSEMRNWFSVPDLAQFKQAGYRFYRFGVSNYRMANGHAIFLRESVIEVAELPISVLERQ